MEEKKKKILASYLGAIADLLDEARSKFIEGEVPTREGNELVSLVNHTDSLVDFFKDQEPDLVDVFKVQLPRVRQLMRDADFFMDGEVRALGDGEELKSTVQLKPNVSLNDLPKAIIQEACTEMKRAAAALSFY